MEPKVFHLGLKNAIDAFYDMKTLPTKEDRIILSHNIPAIVETLHMHMNDFGDSIGVSSSTMSRIYYDSSIVRTSVFRKVIEFFHEIMADYGCELFSRTQYACLNTMLNFGYPMWIDKTDPKLIGHYIPRRGVNQTHKYAEAIRNIYEWRKSRGGR